MPITISVGQIQRQPYPENPGKSLKSKLDLLEHIIGRTKVQRRSHIPVLLSIQKQRELESGIVENYIDQEDIIHHQALKKKFKNDLLSN